MGVPVHSRGVRLMRTILPIVALILLTSACSEDPVADVGPNETVATNPSQAATPTTAPAAGAPSLETSTSSIESQMTGHTTIPPAGTPQMPEPTGGWSLRSGDVLVAGPDGVVVVRDGVVVHRPVISPAHRAFVDAEGAIVFTIPDPGSHPEYWVDPSEKGNDRIWRVHPDGRLEVLFSGSGVTDGSTPTLYQVYWDDAPPGETVIFTTSQSLPSEAAFSRSSVWNWSLHAPAVLQTAMSIPTPGEGGVTGIGWLPSEEVFVMSVQSEGGTSLSLSDAVGQPVSWPGNPETMETRCSADEGFNDCLAVVTVIPDTSLIAYVVSDLSGLGIDDSKRATDLVTFDLSTGTEVDRTRILTGPGYSTQDWSLTASNEAIALSWGWYIKDEQGNWQGRRTAAIYEIGTRTLNVLPIEGFPSLMWWRDNARPSADGSNS